MVKQRALNTTVGPTTNGVKHNIYVADFLGKRELLDQRARAAFWAEALRCAFDTPFQRALPPAARFSSGHSWPHLGHLCIGFADLADGNNLGWFDGPIADQFDQDAVAVDLAKGKANILFALLRHAVFHGVIYFHANSMRASSYIVNWNLLLQIRGQRLEILCDKRLGVY